MPIPERQFFNEKHELRAVSVSCSRCRHVADYQVKWMRRTRKDQVPQGADERDRANFAKLRDYLIRIDDEVSCAKCKRRIEIPSHQSLVFL